MKNFMIVFIIVLNCLFILDSCVYDPVDFRLKIYNSSNSTIYFSHSFNYPDTLITFRANPFKSPIDYCIKPRENKAVKIIGKWEGEFEIYDTLMIFIFDEATLKTVPWDTIRKNYMILKRYDLSLEDLVKMEWRVTYP